MQRLPNKFGIPSKIINSKSKINVVKDNIFHNQSQKEDPILLDPISIENVEPLTIAYFTCRNDPKIEWFFRSLNRELNGKWTNIYIIIIDYHYQFKPEERYSEFKKHYEMYTTNVKHVSPKPCPLQGKYKVTKDNYFAASNARNTAFINCNTPYIVCIDDLTVLKNGWIDVVRWGQKKNCVIFGSYAKVKKLECLEDGSYTYNQESLQKGLDSRYNNASILDEFATLVTGSWMFGCSFALPLDIAYDIDGFDEACDGQSAEDYDFGMRIGRVTADIYYSKQMFTYEDDDLHFTPGNVGFKRESLLLTEGTLLKDKIGIMSDHAILQRLISSNSKYPLIPSNLKRVKEIYEVNEIELTRDFNERVYWRTGELWNLK